MTPSPANLHLVVCEQCGSVHRWQHLRLREVAQCGTCRAVLGRGHPGTLSPLLALTVAAAVLFPIALTTPLLTLSLRGADEHTYLPEAIAAVLGQGQEAIAVLVALTALLAPAAFIALRLYVLLPLVAGRRPPGFGGCMRTLHHADRWNMIEVFTIGVLLSLVRLGSLADARPGPGLFALGTLMLLFAGIQAAGLKRLWWHGE